MTCEPRWVNLLVTLHFDRTKCIISSFLEGEIEGEQFCPKFFLKWPKEWFTTQKFGCFRWFSLFIVFLLPNIFPNFGQKGEKSPIPLHFRPLVITMISLHSFFGAEKHSCVFPLKKVKLHKYQKTNYIRREKEELANIGSVIGEKCLHFFLGVGNYSWN